MFFFDERSKVHEYEIQTLYQTYPYLIEDDFFGQNAIPQYRLPSGLADLVVFLENEVIIIELKVVPLDDMHLLQLYGYLQDISERMKNEGKIANIRGILIGFEPKSDLNKSISVLDYDIKVKILGKDVPIKIKICAKCRRAIDISSEKCKYCGNTTNFI